MASVDSVMIIEAAHETGTVAVIRSPHFERLTPRVSRRGRIRMLHHLRVQIKITKKKIIMKTKTNHNQYW